MSDYQEEMNLQPDGGDPASAEDQEQLTIEQRLERSEAEAQEYLDGWQRARAEFANFKRRTDREREEMRQRVSGEIITRYLGVLDDFERALQGVPDDVRESPWLAGIELIYAKLKTILESEGVETIEATGDFDPNLHEAISFEDSEDHDEGEIIGVTQKGYRIGDRVLRPAMVRVAK